MSGPEGRPGAWLLAVSDVCGSVWALGPPDGTSTSFDRGALQAWRDAASALSRSLPVVWRSVKGAADDEPAARFRDAVPRPGCAVAIEHVLAGRSFGLSFLLAQAARVLDLPLPGDVFASATLDPWGALGKVEGLAWKARAARRVVPHGGTLYVAHDQEEGLAEAEDAGFEVLKRRNAGQVVREVFPDLEAALTRPPASAAEREERVQAFFRLALGKRASLVEWTPVARAAERLAEAWRADLDPTQGYRLAFAGAVARRHDGERAELALPDEAWLRSLPSPVREDCLAHVVQHAADTATPDPGAVRELAGRFLPGNERDQFPSHLGVRGGLARLGAHTGGFEAALREQEALARAFLARGEVASITFQLSEMFRLAGALCNEAAFARTTALQQEAALLGDLDEHHGVAYVEVARGRALVQLGRAAEATEVLRRHGGRKGAPDHLFVMAARWHVAALEDAGAPEGSGPARRALEDLRGKPGTLGRNARRALHLVALDDALRAGDRPAAAAAVEAFLGVEPEPLGQLLAARDEERWPDREAYVQRFYPY